MMRGKVKWAIAVSLVGHVVLLFVFVQACALLRQPSPVAGKIVDRRIEQPESYPPVTFRFEEMPSSPTPTPPLPVSPPMPANPLPPSSPKDNGPSRTEESMNPISPSIEEHGKTGETAAAPLHGKLTKPGSSIVYVLDRSGSMGRDRKLRQAIAILKASLKQLGPDVRFQIVTYDNRATIARIGNSLDLVPANTANIAETVAQLEELIGEGSSRHSEGLRTGLGLHPDTLILLTDADELSPKDVKQLKEWNRKGTSIHAVLIGAASEKESSALRDLAGAGHVHFIAAPGLVQ